MEFDDTNNGLNKRCNKQLLKTKLRKEKSTTSHHNMIEGQEQNPGEASDNT